MLNCYCREHLIFYAFCGTDITAGAQYEQLHSLAVAVQAHQLSSGRFFYNTIYEFYTR